MNHINQKIIQNKLGLLNLAAELGNISKACQVMGTSRETFYRYKEAYESGGIEALLEKNRRQPNLKNRVDEKIEQAVLQMAVDYPAFGQWRVSNELKQQGVIISPSGVRSIWLRHDQENLKKRLKTLEAKVAEEGIVLTEAQLQALEKKQQDDVACGEIETHHPGYLGSQDTFYVGHFKGIGRVYQQTYVDTYSKVAQGKLYNTKNALTAADHLNDKVLPFYEQLEIEILRILTDRGTEYCGKLETHEYQLYLAINSIEHTKTKARSPQTNGICERFHRTVLEEFYQVALRKKIYLSLDELQQDLDNWLDYYNNQRTHQGKHCNGRTPMQTLLEGKQICQDKLVA